MFTTLCILGATTMAFSCAPEFVSSRRFAAGLMFFLVGWWGYAGHPGVTLDRQCVLIGTSATPVAAQPSSNDDHTVYDYGDERDI